MNDKQLKQILIQLAEDGVPAEANLWPALRARLEGRAAFAHTTKGYPMLKPIFAQPRAARAVGVTTVVVLLLAAALFVTPQGRAWAESVWRYFSLAPSESFAVTPVAAPPANAPTAAAPAANAEACGADMACQVASAEEMLGFAPVVPAEGFAGLKLEAVQAAGGILRLSYVAEGGGGLVLSQGQGDLTASRWDAVPAEFVEPVRVGDAAAEFVQGTFVAPADSGTATWSTDAPVLRLRWQTGNRYFELAKLGDPEHLEHLDKAALIALAEMIK